MPTTKHELDKAMVATVWPVLDPQGATRAVVAEYDKAWVDFTLAVQELKDAVHMLDRERSLIDYFVCEQDPAHVWDYDDPRIGMVETNWRTRGKSRCPSCSGILAKRTAKVYKR